MRGWSIAQLFLFNFAGLFSIAPEQRRREKKKEGGEKHFIGHSLVSKIKRSHTGFDKVCPVAVSARRTKLLQ
jgi:hypothetical protein